MNKHKNIALALAGATSCLSGISAVSAAELNDKADLGQWDIKSAILYYSESDRVTAVEPVIYGTKQLDTDESVSFKIVIDSLTGASASGAVPSDTAQTYTTPSGDSSYTIQANETPLDDTFHDTRLALSGNWVKPLSRLNTLTLAANISNEYDYLSLSTSALFARDFNNRNTTLSGGLSVGFDQISSVGGIPSAFGVMQAPDQEQPREGSEDDKTLIDIVLGVTQVLDKHSIFLLNYSFGQSDGYLTDPYKVISVVDAVSGNPNATIFENRPDSRTKHALYAQYKRNFSGNVLDASYRFATDDFGVDSNTIDLRYKFRLGDGTSFFQPHLRYYSQTAADFYVPYFIEGDQPNPGDLNQFATADYRMGEFVGTTIGLEYGRDSDKSWAIALEYYLQSGNEPANKVGQLNNQELYPDVDAVMVRFNYDF